jgi:hypothetical protein
MSQPLAPVDARDTKGLQRYFVFAALLFIFTAIRSWGRLWRYDELWAEDGAKLLPELLTDGWRALDRPMDGYYFTFQSLIDVPTVAVGRGDYGVRQPDEQPPRFVNGVTIRHPAQASQGAVREDAVGRRGEAARALSKRIVCLEECLLSPLGQVL